MRPPSSLEALIQALRCLPGVGPKSAQRMAYQLLERNRDAAGVNSHAVINEKAGQALFRAGLPLIVEGAW